MKESLFDILNRHANWMQPQDDGSDIEEMRHAAALYAESLLPLADRWGKAVENDVSQICTHEPPHTHFNKERQAYYRMGVNCFLSAVADALRGHGFDIGQLDHVTQWRVGNLARGTSFKEGLSRDEAGQLVEKMEKQGFYVHCFRELCSDQYTVLNWQQIGNNEPQPIPKVLDTDEAKGYFKKAVELGLMTDDFGWLKGLQMLACFAREMSLKMNLGKGGRISWKPFEALFGVPDGKLRLNYNDIQKTGQAPSEAYLIDQIFK